MADIMHVIIILSMIFYFGPFLHINAFLTPFLHYKDFMFRIIVPKLIVCKKNEVSEYSYCILKIFLILFYLFFLL